jgi:hypothetical protein
MPWVLDRLYKSLVDFVPIFIQYFHFFIAIKLPISIDLMKLLKLTIPALAFLALHADSTYSQELKFFNRYGEHPVDFSEQIKQTPDGNLLTLSSIRRPNSLGQIIRDLYFIKTNLDGDTIWTKYAGQDGRSELAREMTYTNDGHLLVTGFSTYNLGNTTKGFLMCFDSAGTLMWEKYYGDGINIWAFTSLTIVDDGIIMAGTVANAETEDSDALVLKVSHAGDSLWSTTYGGELYDDAWDIEPTPDGGIVFTGGTYSFAEGDLDDAWIVKLNAEGTFQWRKTYGFPDRIDWAWAFVPAHNAEGNIDGYVFTGVTDAGDEGSLDYLNGSIHLVKVDLDGEVVWNKSIVVPGALRREGTDIVSTTDGGFAICGFALHSSGGTPNSSLYFAKIDEHGDIEYSILADDIPDVVIPRALTQASNEDFYITGNAATSMGATNSAFIASIGNTTNIAQPKILASRIQIFPNPTHDVVTIKQPLSCHIKSVALYSLDGRILLSQQIPTNGDVNLSLAAYKGSTVFLHVITDAGYTYAQKVVVQ